jgi:NADH dehydrogenase (ubiquinone) Fe-S protein 3
MASRSSLVALRTAVRSRTAVVAPVARSLRTSTALRAGNPSVPEASQAPFSEPVGINPADKLAPLNSPLHEYGQYLTTCLPKFVQQFSVYKDELTLYIPPQAVVPVLTFLRDHTQCQYKAVMDITAVDYPTRQNRFEVGLAHPDVLMNQADVRSFTISYR